jgi:hypothetical protein
MRWTNRSNSHRTRIASLVLLSLLAARLAQAEEAGENTDAYEIGIHAGPFLPSRISRVREIVQAWGPQVTIPTRKGLFEISSFHGRGSGIVYNSLSLDYRADIVNSILPVHVLLGIHGDYYAPPDDNFKFGGGWHFGGGVTQEITRALLLRTDFTYRFSPGNSLYVGVGLVYRFLGGGAGS